jgi:flagellin
VTAINAAATASAGSATTIAAVTGDEITLTADATNALTIGGAAQSSLGFSASVATSGTSLSTGVDAAVTAAAVEGTPAPYTLGSTTIQIGTATAVDVAGTYDTAQDLVDAINSQVSGSYASIDDTNHLVISSGEAITLGGAGATALGVATAAVGGALNAQNVKDVDGANATILSVDAALTSVSNLRSSLGAIQNRFQSVINSLQAVSENLSASRSRILDTDFASETASLTRAQILQQAGTAMVAQANSAPQNVLSLLRG